jgi:thiol peroxidase
LPTPIHNSGKNRKAAQKHHIIDINLTAALRPQQINMEAEMEERKGAVTLQGNPFTLVGTQLQVGMPAPDVTLLDNDLNPVSLSNFKGKVCIVSAVPSLDTPTCDMETRRFNDEAAKLDDAIAILTVSMDLPFAQKRWCGAAGIDKVKTLSDHQDASFGTSFGVLIKELRLLARAIFVVDKEGTIQYIQLVKEIADEPDYQEVLDAAKKLV